MPKTRMMGAGLAGSTAYFNRVNGDQGGGMKLQGLAPTTNKKVQFVLRNIQNRAYGQQRDHVFCMNQIGGIGAVGSGNRSRAFATTADGVNKSQCKSGKHVFKPWKGTCAACTPGCTKTCQGLLYPTQEELYHYDSCGNIKKGIPLSLQAGMGVAQFLSDVDSCCVNSENVNYLVLHIFSDEVISESDNGLFNRKHTYYHHIYRADHCCKPIGLVGVMTSVATFSGYHTGLSMNEIHKVEFLKNVKSFCSAAELANINLNAELDVDVEITRIYDEISNGHTILGDIWIYTGVDEDGNLLYNSTTDDVPPGIGHKLQEVGCCQENNEDGQPGGGSDDCISDCYNLTINYSTEILSAGHSVTYMNCYNQSVTKELSEVLTTIEDDGEDSYSQLTLPCIKCCDGLEFYITDITGNKTARYFTNDCGTTGFGIQYDDDTDIIELLVGVVVQDLQLEQSYADCSDEDCVGCLSMPRLTIVELNKEQWLPLSENVINVGYKKRCGDASQELSVIREIDVEVPHTVQIANLAVPEDQDGWREIYDSMGASGLVEFIGTNNNTERIFMILENAHVDKNLDFVSESLSKSINIALIGKYEENDQIVTDKLQYHILSLQQYGGPKPDGNGDVENLSEVDNRICGFKNDSNMKLYQYQLTGQSVTSGSVLNLAAVNQSYYDVLNYMIGENDGMTHGHNGGLVFDIPNSANHTQIIGSLNAANSLSGGSFIKISQASPFLVQHDANNSCVIESCDAPDNSDMTDGTETASILASFRWRTGNIEDRLAREAHFHACNFATAPIITYAKAGSDASESNKNVLHTSYNGYGNDCDQVSEVTYSTHSKNIVSMQAFSGVHELSMCRNGIVAGSKIEARHEHNKKDDGHSQVTFFTVPLFTELHPDVQNAVNSNYGSDWDFLVEWPNYYSNAGATNNGNDMTRCNRFAVGKFLFFSGVSDVDHVANDVLCGAARWVLLASPDGVGGFDSYFQPYVNCNGLFNYEDIRWPTLDSLGQDANTFLMLENRARLNLANPCTNADNQKAVMTYDPTIGGGNSDDGYWVLPFGLNAAPDDGTETMLKDFTITKGCDGFKFAKIKGKYYYAYVTHCDGNDNLLSEGTSNMEYNNIVVKSQDWPDNDKINKIELPGIACNKNLYSTEWPEGVSFMTVAMLVENSSAADTLATGSHYLVKLDTPVSCLNSSQEIDIDGNGTMMSVKDVHNDCYNSSLSTLLPTRFDENTNPGEQTNDDGFSYQHMLGVNSNLRLCYANFSFSDDDDNNIENNILKAMTDITNFTNVYGDQQNITVNVKAALLADSNIAPDVITMNDDPTDIPNDVLKVCDCSNQGALNDGNVRFRLSGNTITLQRTDFEEAGNLRFIRMVDAEEAAANTSPAAGAKLIGQKLRWGEVGLSNSADNETFDIHAGQVKMFGYTGKCDGFGQIRVEDCLYPSETDQTHFDFVVAPKCNHTGLTIHMKSSLLDTRNGSAADGYKDVDVNIPDGVSLIPMLKINDSDGVDGYYFIINRAVEHVSACRSDGNTDARSVLGYTISLDEATGAWSITQSMPGISSDIVGGFDGITELNQLSGDAQYTLYYGLNERANSGSEQEEAGYQIYDYQKRLDCISSHEHVWVKAMCVNGWFFPTAWVRSDASDKCGWLGKLRLEFDGNSGRKMTCDAQNTGKPGRLGYSA